MLTLAAQTTGPSTNMASVLIAITATVLLLRWAARPRRTCGTCHGTGAIRPGHTTQICRRCNGTGRPRSIFR